MIRKIILSFIILFLGITYIYSQSIEKGPYMIYPNDNTKMTILWQLSSTTTCTIEWGKTTAYGSSQTVLEYGSDHQFKYTITGLTPDTKYHYKVSWGSNILTNAFKTAPVTSATAVQFLAYGDTRTFYDKTNLVTERMLLEISNDTNYQTFSLHTGDWVNKGQNASTDEWGSQFFNRSSSGTNNIIFQSKVPIMGVRGNHENYTQNYSPYENATNFYKYFPYTFASGSTNGDDMYYSFDYGPVHIAVIDQYDDNPSQNSISTAQKTWLQNDLANSDKPWKFILLHEPGWSAASTSKSEHGNNTDVQNNIQPICIANGVQAVFGGHNHYYAHCLVNGVHHFTLGGGGAPLYDPSYTSGGVVVKAERTYHFLKVNINGRNATLTVERPDGTTVETINLTIPVIDPTNFVATPATTSEIDLTWNQNGDNDDILLAYNTTNTFGTPTGTYNVGDNITGGGQVIALGDIESFNHTSLSAQTYYYKIWSKSGTEYSNGITANTSPVVGEPSNHVTNFTAVNPTANTITLTWTDATGSTLPSGYLVKATTGGTITDPADGFPENNGTFSKNVAQGIGTVIFDNLNTLTSYDFKIFPYTNSGASINYKIDGTVPSASGTTIDMPSECENETFDNLTTGSSSYSTETFTGQDGSTWTSTQTRTDQTLGNGAAVCIKGSSSGYLESGTITNGISKIIISTKRAFSGGSGTVAVKVNGSTVGTVPYGTNLQTSSIENINISGDISLRFEPSGDRVIIDDIVWECFGGGSSNDATTTVTTPTGGQPASSNITSAQTDCNSPVDVFAFDIVDDGASDGKPTSITNIRLKPGATNTADWTVHIQDVKVNNGSSFITTGTVVITDNYIDIPISAGDFNIADGHSGTATIAICLNNSGLTNGNILSFKVDALNHGFTADASGSQFANTFNNDVTSNDFTIEVLCMEPTTNSSVLNFSNLTQTTIDLDWTSGNGANRIVVAKEGSSVDAMPVDNTTYTANTTFGLGDEIGTGNFVVYNGHSNSVSITGLSENTNYFFKIFEFNCNIGEENYLTSGSIAEGNTTTTGLGVVNYKSDLRIYPNPTNGIFTFETVNNNLIENIRITNISGQEIINTPVNSTKTNVNFTNYSKGIYFSEIKIDNKLYRRKILKK